MFEAIIGNILAGFGVLTILAFVWLAWTGQL